MYLQKKLKKVLLRMWTLIKLGTVDEVRPQLHIRLRAATTWAQSHIRLHCLAKIRSNQFSNRGLEQDGSMVIIMIWRARV